MEHQFEPLDILIEKIRRQRPAPTDGDLLTDSIMRAIADKPRKQSLPVFIVLVRAISSAAAVFLLALFLFQQTAVEQAGSSQNVVYQLITERAGYKECFQSVHENEKPDMTSIYSCYVEHNLQNKKSVKPSLIKIVQQYKKQQNEKSH